MWQGRFKSWVVLDEDYLYTLFRYFELNPIKAGAADAFGAYPRTFLYDLKQGSLPKCAKESLFARYELSNLFVMPEVELTESDEEILKTIKKQNRALRKDPIFQNGPDPDRRLKKSYQNRAERDAMIVAAYKNGLKQSEITKFYGLSPSSVSKIVKRTG